jgi:NAD(P)-dependent dehydrogenase (short-subunit alcohol dehydrogenase family)
MILDRFKLTDSVAIVTGAGKGIDHGIALALAEAGTHVICGSLVIPSHGNNSSLLELNSAVQAHRVSDDEARAVAYCAKTRMTENDSKIARLVVR